MHVHTSLKLTSYLMASQHLHKEMKTTWNKLVDEYIRQDQNPCSKEEIERFAKIDGANLLYSGCAITQIMGNSRVGQQGSNAAQSVKRWVGIMTS